MSDYEMEDLAYEINVAGAKVAREVADENTGHSTFRNQNQTAYPKY